MAESVAQTPVRGRGEAGPEGWVLLRDPKSAYRDGAEEKLLELIRATSDVSSDSDELIAKANDWPTRYHLEPARANVLKALELPAGARVLEIGAGCGAVTRYLGETCALVDALEPVPARATVARERTRDLPNVEVFVGELDDLPEVESYDIVVVVGVLEYAGNGAAELAPYLEFLRHIESRLVAGGSLVLAIENKLGVKYLAGSPEDHTNRIFDSLEGYPYGAHARTFTRHELTDLFMQAGLTPEVKAAFPDYKLTRAVLGDFPERTRSLLHRIPQFPSPDWLSPRPRLVDESRLWRSLVEGRLESDFSNSFLVLAGKGEAASLWPAGRAGAFFSVGRKASYSASTFVEVCDGSVNFRRVTGAGAGTGAVKLLTTTDSTAPYCDGRDLVEVIAETSCEVERLLSDWLALLNLGSDGDGGIPIDLVPHNLVVDEAGGLHVIDLELSSEQASRDQVVRRGILWLAQRLAPRCVPQRWPGLETVRDLAVHLGSMVGLDPSSSWLHDAIVEEAAIQAEVRVGPPAGSSHAAWVVALADHLDSGLSASLSGLPLGVRLPEALEALEALEARMAAAEAERAAALSARDAAVAALDAEVAALDAAVAALDGERMRHAARYETLEAQNEQLEVRLKGLELARASAETALHELSASRGVRILSRYRRGLEKAMPRDSRQRAAYRRLTHSPLTAAPEPVTAMPEPVTAAPEPVTATPEPVPEITLRTSNDPVVSVIIPVYGKWDFTFRCLQSIAADAIQVPFEIVVVDDASLDQTRTELANVHGIRVVPLDENIGFLAACNAGIKEAQGRFVMLLNNDTEVTSGWLDALVGTASDEKVGAVGARLIYPDGSLQEAGGIIFADGNGWNFGRNANADDPRYNFRRSVDYCSGAALLVRKDVLGELGGFDTRFAPAYYEDTDLCFAVRARGLDVVYQPAATVIHHEGVSHGTDEKSGVKAYQEINRLKFVEKWRDQLANQPVNDPSMVPLTAWRGHLCVVVIFYHYVPRPDQDSGSKRQVGIMKTLVDLGYGVLFVPDSGDRTEPYSRQLQDAGIEVLYGQLDLASHLQEIAPLIRLAIVARPDVGWRFIPQLRQILPECPIAYDTVDLHFLRERRQAELEGDQSLARRAGYTRQRELALMRLSDTALVVSTAEVEVLAKEAPDVRVRVLSNVHRPEVSFASISGRSDLLFVGNFTHTPNTDGVLWFVNKILPLISARRPDVRLRIVGGDLSEEVLAAASETVEILGWVPDLEPIYLKARVVVAPLRYGAGVKGKVAESLSYGVPVVTTQVGAEGMGLVDNVTARIVDGEADFADAVVDLLVDDEKWSRLSRVGLRHVDERFGADATRQALADLLSTGVAALEA